MNFRSRLRAALGRPPLDGDVRQVRIKADSPEPWNSLGASRVVEHEHSFAEGAKAAGIGESPKREPRGFYGEGGGNRKYKNRMAGTHLKAFAGGDDAIDWVHAGVSLIAETGSAAPWHLEEDGEVMVRQKTDKTPADAKVAPEDLVKLLDRPNPNDTWTDLFEIMVIDYKMTGDAWVWKYRGGRNNRPVSLIRCHPADITIETNAKGGIKEYTYNPEGSANPITIPKNEMIHFKAPNPHEPFLGAGVVAMAPRIYDLEINLTKSITQYFEKGTRLSGVLETEKSVGSQLFDKIKRTFADFYSGADNAYEVAVLERGLSYRPIANNSTEAQYVEQAAASRDRILAGLRTPLPLFGITAGADRQAVAEAQRIFDNKTMRPLLDRFQETITLDLTMPGWGVSFVIEYEYLPPKEDQLELAGTIAGLPGITVREVREAAGYEALGDSEVDDIVLNLPGEDDNDSEVKDEPLPGEAGRPPKAENKRAIPRDGKLPADAAARKPKTRTRAKVQS